MWPSPSGQTLRTLLFCLVFSLQGGGVHCGLEISLPGPPVVNAKVGSNVTLAVALIGAPDPEVTWLMGTLPVVTWKIGSQSTPDIPDIHNEVLKVEPNGSLTFVNVQLSYSNNYTLEITKAGLGQAAAVFSLKVYDSIQNVTVSTEPDYATEGLEQFTLQYSTLAGVADRWMWSFNGVEIKTDSHYTVGQKKLVIIQPNRNDTGQYTLVLMNPYSHAVARKNITVLFGPDEPVVEASPAKPFYVSGDSLNLSCQAQGFPHPSTKWVFGGQTLSSSPKGVLNLTNVQISQGGVYTCMLLNEKTGAKRQKNVIVKVYEWPLGSPLCSVQSVNTSALQYHCRWAGGTPKAQLSFPALSNGSSEAEDLRLTVNASEELDGKTVFCLADHPLRRNTCNITTRSPARFLPRVRTTVDLDGKIMVAIRCVTEASPGLVVSWFRGGKALNNSTRYQISVDTTQLVLREFNISSSLLQNYTCICHNPLGRRRRDTRLQGPAISDSSLFPNQDGTVVTLTWEVPPTSVVTGFDIQMKGPDLLSHSQNQNQSKSRSKEYRSIQRKPGTARSTDILVLDPESTYRFRIIPSAGLTVGHASESHRIGPGLSGPAIAGIAAGIPCSLLLLLLLIGLIYLCIYRNRKRDRQTRYPVSRAVEKAVGTQPDRTPHSLLTGGLKPLPDYNRLRVDQTPSERSVPLPTFVPPPPVRTATTV
ncbi:V-set and immunoglobulin domain-containing protein 10-like [Lampris incognitus]|uniref:V-set and immunoglobulin domain-containing protein 10-like n=1 Tax=Lampris incognitus TaxID=2546036 RepID=UPI0024B55BCE|nr:V-set and immunoglobulin domain-containing protein 10-like [Lampris incognitus]